MSKIKQSIQKKFMEKGYNVDFIKKNGKYYVYKLGVKDGYFINLSDAKDYLSTL